MPRCQSCVAVGACVACRPGALWQDRVSATLGRPCAADCCCCCQLLLCWRHAGRVYCGRWRGLDVAVKVLHHDVNTAASVANEVDLVMSFRWTAREAAVPDSSARTCSCAYSMRAQVSLCTQPARSAPWPAAVPAYALCLRGWLHGRTHMKLRVTRVCVHLACALLCCL